VRVSRDEVVLREMLGRWVSESEPCLAVRQGTGEIIGLTRYGDPTGTIVLTPT